MAKEKMSKADAGRKGGQTTKARHGTEHYRRAGKLGFAKSAERLFNGDREAYLRWLASRALPACLAPLMSPAARIADLLHTGQEHHQEDTDHGRQAD